MLLSWLLVLGWMKFGWMVFVWTMVTTTRRRILGFQLLDCSLLASPLDVSNPQLQVSSLIREVELTTIVGIGLAQCHA